MSDHISRYEYDHRGDDLQIHPMKWYKFLIYFALFAGALISLSNALQYLTGSIYLSEGLTEADVDALYDLHGGFKVLDMIYGLTCIGSAVLDLITRSRLRHFHRTAPAFVLAVPVYNVFCSSMYTILSCGIARLDVFEFLPQVIGSILGVAIYIWPSYIYFNKRRNLFVNE
ncbi:MAG: hypothetical protein J6J43_01330 [Oscillospiraceae bacterium]|nr:hypothetical protein [Oscillospiraceae bacterium]